MDLERELTRLVEMRNVERCAVCQGKLQYVGSGKYCCISCRTEKLDEFGIIKKYLEDHGPTTGVEISRETGIGMDTINRFLQKGMVEITNNSNFFTKCKKCGCGIRCGRYCPTCAKTEIKNGNTILCQEIGERPKENYNSSVMGKMHFAGGREK